MPYRSVEHFSLNKVRTHREWLKADRENNAPVAIGRTACASEILGDPPELDDQVAGQVFGLGLAAAI
jgi:hypothetical protein